MNETSVKNSKYKTAPTLSTQTYLRIAEIRDNVIILKNGGLRSILKVSSINFNLKSEEEQNAIIYSYQGFLNTLDFPIQILIRSKKLDIDSYIEKLHQLSEKQTNNLLKKQTVEYTEYIQKLVEYADIMEKEFLVVVAYDPYRAKNLNPLEKFISYINPKDDFAKIKQRRNEFEELKKGLNQRINSVKSGLENCGLKVNETTTRELIELLYNVHNPNTSRNQKLKNSLEFNIKDDETLFSEDKII